MPRLFLTLALLLAPIFTATFALAEPLNQSRNQPLPQSLAGFYDVWGRNLDGAVYSGTAEIREDGKAIKIFWTTTAGKYSGSGTRDGNVMLIDWGSEYLIVYTVMEDGELHGTWADGYALDRLSPQ